MHSNHRTKIAEDILNQAFLNTEDAILLIKDNHFVHFNPAAIKILGAKNDAQLLNTHPADLSPKYQPDGRFSLEKANAMIEIALDKGFHRFEWMHKRLNGEEFPCEVCLIRTITNDNEVVLHTTWRNLSQYKQQELQFTQVLQQTNIGYVTLTEKGNIVSANQPFISLLGLSKLDDIKGHSVFEWIPQELVQSNQKAMKKCLSSGVVTDFKTEFILADKTRIYVLINASLQHYSPSYTFIALCKNITQQVKIEESLRYEAVRRTTIQKLLEDAINCRDQKIFLNNALATLIDEKSSYSAEKGAIFLLQGEPPVLKMQVSKNLTEEHQQLCATIKYEECLCGKAVSQDKVFHKKSSDVEYEINFKQSQRNDIYSIPIHAQEELVGVLLLYSQKNTYPRQQDKEHLQAAANIIGRTLQWIKADDEIVSSHRATEEKEHLLNQIINTALDSIITINEHGIVQSFNPAATQLFGYSEQEMLGKNISVLTPSPHREQHDQYLQRYLSTQESRIVGKPRQLNAIKKDGLEFPIRLSISQVPLANRILFCGFIQDLSLQKQLEMDLRQHAELLQNEVEAQTKQLTLAKNIAEQANISKSEFLANMSHELRTPLHGILSFSHLGIKNIDQGNLGKLETYFDRIHTSGQRLLVLLNDLLDLAKLEARQMSLEIRQHDLTQVIEYCICEFEAQLEEKQITIHCHNTGFNTTASFDKIRIMQVVSNLLSNAIKFSEAGQSIFIDLSLSAPSGLLCSIRDQGIGIPKNELQSVFDKFIQSSKTKTNAGGTGLGLAICQEIIMAHNGKIWAEQGETSGSVFKFIVPNR